MRIFCAIRHSNDGSFYGNLWKANLYPALRQLGCEVVESETDLLPATRFMAVAKDFTSEELDVRARTTDKILSEVREAKRRGPVHLFLSYFYNAHFDPSGFAQIRGLGIPSVNFYCNSIHQFDLVSAIASQVDFAWHPEKDARPSYLSIGANPIWVQMGADPGLYRPIEGIERQPMTCFVGQRYADREKWLAALLEANIPVDIYGSGWRQEAERSCGLAQGQHYLGRKQIVPGSYRSYFQVVADEVRRYGPLKALTRISARTAYKLQTRGLSRKLQPRVMGRAGELAKVLSTYEVCLNFSNVWADGTPGSRMTSHVRLRDFEAPMCRTCYLTGHSDEILEFYDVGREIDTYRDELELVDKIRFYLANPIAAEGLREAGFRRALRDHTWTRRFEQLFAKIGLSTDKS
jgi:hypothetical protein